MSHANHIPCTSDTLSFIRSPTRPHKWSSTVFKQNKSKNMSKKDKWSSSEIFSEDKWSSSEIFSDKTWRSAIHLHPLFSQFLLTPKQKQNKKKMQLKWRSCTTNAAVNGYLELTSWSFVKDSTPSRRRILRFINFGIGESSPNLFLSMLNLYLEKIEVRWILNERAFHCYYFVYLKVNLYLEKTNQLGESSPNFIFMTNNLDPIVIEKRWTGGESWPNDFGITVNRGLQDALWRVHKCASYILLYYEKSL